MKTNLKGFSLLELSIVLVVLGFMTSGTITITTAIFQISKQSETKQRMQIIEKAINAYIVENRKLPCPAGIKLNTTNNNYGDSICVDNPVNGVKLVATDIFVGTIPVKELKLETKYMFDGWNNKFIYMAMKDYTTVNENLLKNNIDSSKLINNKFSFSIISHGKNRIGGINFNGSKENLRDVAKATSGELKNIYSNINTNTITEFRDVEGFDDLVLAKNKDNIIQELDIYDTGCVIETTFNDVLEKNDCSISDYTFSPSLSVGMYFKYKERMYSVNSIENDDIQKKCVIECGNYGKFIVFINEKIIEK